MINPDRQIVLDTETTGMNQIGAHYEGHCIIEIGAVEMINRKYTGNNFHIYIKPDRLVDPDAIKVHGITDEMLADKPDFKTIAQDFIEYIRGAELLIHNAPFDVGFMDYEFRKLGLDIKTTNNRMELRAVIEALNSLKEPCHVTLYSDSQYMKNGITQWIYNWKKNNWKASTGKAVKNQDLWIALDQAIQIHNIDWQWVKGHSGHRENEICDELAKQGAENPTFEDIGYEG